MVSMSPEQKQEKQIFQGIKKLFLFLKVSWNCLT